MKLNQSAHVLLYALFLYLQQILCVDDGFYTSFVYFFTIFQCYLPPIQNSFIVKLFFSSEMLQFIVTHY